jgi:TolA-binding protein
MKRTERRHLRENEIERLTREAREMFEERRRGLTWTVAAVVVVGIVAIGYFAWREQVQTRAHNALAEAMAVQEARIGPPPAPGTVSKRPYFPTEGERAQAALVKFKAAADAYPSTTAGIFARYQQASIALAVGKTVEAEDAYREVMRRAGNRIYGQMARLGLAEAQARAGQYDQAIATFKEITGRTDSTLPLDGILMQLGRTYLDAGKPTEAQQTFNRLVDEFPNSPFNADAKRALEGLKKA